MYKSQRPLKVKAMKVALRERLAKESRKKRVRVMIEMEVRLRTWEICLVTAVAGNDGDIVDDNLRVVDGGC